LRTPPEGALVVGSGYVTLSEIITSCEVKSLLLSENDYPARAVCKPQPNDRTTRAPLDHWFIVGSRPEVLVWGSLIGAAD
jgi:hypothetical protein